MGWFGTGPLDGDDGMDLQDNLFGMIKVQYDDEYNIISSDKKIKYLLETKQNEIYDWLRDYNWQRHSNPGFIQEVYIQATAQIMLDYDVKINKRGKVGMLDFAKNDHWAKDDNERKISMDLLIKELNAN